jgi:hypothetical protein
MTMTVGAGQVELEPPVLNEPALAEDIVDECGFGSFPASDPPSWWARAKCFLGVVACIGGQ